MNHRIKNVFALTGGLVALSARSARTPGELAENVRERLAALSRAHQLTLGDLEAGDTNERQTTLNALVRTILFPYAESGNAAESRFEIGGPEVEVRGQAVAGLALLLHELATNAAKYGALTTPRGKVSVSWSIRNGTVEGSTTKDGTLDLTWEERGGPPLSGRPANEGFGSLISRTTMTSQLGGELTRAWDAEGLAVRMAIPIERLRQ